MALVPRGIGYPLWFRQRILAEDDGRVASDVLAIRHRVSVATVRRLRRLVAETGSAARRPFSGGRPPILNAASIAYLRQFTILRPDVSRREAVQVMQEFTGAIVSEQVLSLTWKRLRFTRKRLRVFAMQRSEDVRRRFWTSPPDGVPGAVGVLGLHTGAMIDIDECGITLEQCERRVGRAVRGQRAQMPGFYQRGQVRWNVILAIDINRGPVAWWVVPVNVDADVFHLFLQYFLFPQLQPRDGLHVRRSLLWDNLRVHFRPDVLEAVRGAGHRVIARPAYSPDMAPIECAFSKIKMTLRRKRDELTEANLKDKIIQAIQEITPENAQGWFAHCHYNVPGRPHHPYRGPHVV